MGSKPELAVLVAEINSQVGLIESIFQVLIEKNSKKKFSEEEIDSMSFKLHNLYCAFEDLFLIIAKFFENSISDPRRFHKDLLDRMLLEIPGIRPSLLSKKSHLVLNELRGFRHVFRHSYGISLDLVKIRMLLFEIIEKKDEIFQEIKNFLNKL